METVLSLLQHRLNESAHTTLRDIVTGVPALRQVSKPLSSLLSRHQKIIRAELSSKTAQQTLAVGMASGFLKYLFSRYQYIRPSAQDRNCIIDTYRTIASAASDNANDLSSSIEGIISTHHDRLQEIAIGMLSSIGALDDVLHGSDPICRQYSPMLQYEILGLTDEDLTGPVLDIGCGEAAELVDFLRSRGCAAWGVDRLAPGRDYTMRGDWFDLPAIDGGWRTIVAHLAFSLHFVHAHLHSGSEAKHYAAAYMAILKRLQPGGSFIYAPGLPFIESLLEPRHFRVEVQPIRMLAGQVVSSSRVTKRVTPPNAA